MSTSCPLVSRDANHASWLPWHTLVANIIGSVLLGYLLGSPRHTEPPAWATAGVAGGLTTMSGLAVELAAMIDVALYGRTLAYLAITLAAGLGGVARWYAARLTYLPEVATFGVNVIGSLLLGLTVNMSEEWQILLGIALIGASTTFSTFVHDVARLVREGAAGYLIAYTMVGCIAAAWIGIQLAP